MAAALVTGMALGCSKPATSPLAAPPSPGPAPSSLAGAPSPAGPAPEGMAFIPGGEFWMGSDDPRMGADAKPVHRVFVDAFWMDVTEVTNEQFAAFARATGYVTVAERTPRAEDFPGAPAENLVAGSVVFTAPDHAVPLDSHFQWWSYVKGANWRHPEGPKSGIEIADEAPRRACGPSGRAGLREVGGQAAAHGGGVGARGSRRPGPQGLHLG